FNTVKWVLFFFCLSSTFRSATNGLFSVTLSTVEKRFQFSSFQSSILASATEFGQVPALVFIMLCGHNVKQRPLFIGFGTIAVSFGCVLCFLPQFL
ncbi:hypothetical protein HELRODRAFT_146662, partial [Helobdella robusta]|uniref:Major facilitator superfamily (MFS) profile domain-containing protein n=1 Tax=Helobdella robusta TaxID=6412 RepID=T1EJT6_HELRO